jgi:hypothetical protein
METDLGHFIVFFVTLFIFLWIFKLIFSRKPENLLREKPKKLLQFNTPTTRKIAFAIVLSYGQQKALDIHVINEAKGFIVFRRGQKIGLQPALLAVYVSSNDTSTSIEVGIISEVPGGMLYVQQDEELKNFMNGLKSAFRLELQKGDFKNQFTSNNLNSDISVSSEIGKLADMRANGILTDEEFTAAKNKILNKSA